MTLDEIKEIIKANIIEVLEDNDVKVDISTIEDQQIFGAESILDSLDLVGVIASVEGVVQEKTGKVIVIVDENFIVSDDSPLASILSLSNFVLSKINAA
jgi:acyl carrier protein